MGITISFSIAVDTTTATLHAQYKVSNGGDADIYLYNRLHKGVPPRIDSSLVYRQLDEQHQSLMLAKTIQQLPPKVYAVRRVIPFVTAVRSGTTFEEHFQLQLPVVQWQQYNVSTKGTIAKSTSTKSAGGDQEILPVEAAAGFAGTCSLELGYIERCPSWRESEISIAGTSVVSPVPTRDEPANFKSLKSKNIPCKIPVIWPR